MVLSGDVGGLIGLARRTWGDMIVEWQIFHGWSSPLLNGPQLLDLGEASCSADPRVTK